MSYLPKKLKTDYSVYFSYEYAVPVTREQIYYIPDHSRCQKKVFFYQFKKTREKTMIHRKNYTPLSPDLVTAKQKYRRLENLSSLFPESPPQKRFCRTGDGDLLEFRLFCIDDTEGFFRDRRQALVHVGFIWTGRILFVS